MKTKEEIMQIIHHSTGTECYHKFSPFSGYPVITDGVKALADAAGCYWLCDVIGSWQSKSSKLDANFQVWKLLVNEDKTAVIRGYNNGEARVVSQKIPYTDFPLAELKLFLVDDVLMLPSEY